MSKNEKPKNKAADEQAPVPPVATVPPETPAPSSAGQEDGAAPAAPPAQALTLDEVRELDAVRSESADGGVVEVLTKGGVVLRFPGDEEKAGALSDEELFGADVTAAAPPPEATQTADAAALLGDLSPTQRAMAHWGLEQRHLLNSREVELEDGSIEVRILTQGGQRLYFPRDSARVLSDMEKGDAVPSAPGGGIFTK